ncbi:eef1akmt3 [Symbiodinium sp. KB8]|nr:eef1akmt3 [Symbiodinium sp. KB8]
MQPEFAECASGGGPELPVPPPHGEKDIWQRRSIDGVCRSGLFLGTVPQAPPAGLPGTSEAAVAAALPALWRGRSVVELGCGTGYVGLLLAQLGARVTLTDLPKFQEAAAASILATGPHIQPPGRASFCCLDWADLDANARALLKSAHVLVAAEPVTCQCSERDFLSLLEAVLGGGSLLCPRLEGFLVAHKHQQNFCIGGYSAPSREAAPGIVLSDSCDRCTFRRKLQDAGASIGAFAIEPPREFAHPFVECWEIRLPWR